MPSLKHEQKIIELKKDLISKGWICVTSCYYDNKILDLFAYNPITKESKCIEVQLNGEIKHGYDNLPFPVEYVTINLDTLFYHKISPLIRQILRTVSSPYRLGILYLLNESDLSYTDIILHSNKKKSGLVAYHIRFLINAKLIKNENSIYSITNLGKRILTLIKDLEDS